MSSARPDSVVPRPRRIDIEDNSVPSQVLLSRDGKLWVEHDGETYLLRRTAKNRLILTK